MRELRAERRTVAKAPQYELTSVEAMFRRGRVHANMERGHFARADFQSVSHVYQGNEAVQRAVHGFETHARRERRLVEHDVISCYLDFESQGTDILYREEHTQDREPGHGPGHGTALTAQFDARKPNKRAASKASVSWVRHQLSILP